MKKILVLLLATLMVMTLGGVALAAPPISQASGGGTVDWPNGRVTYGFTALQVDPAGDAKGNAVFHHRDTPTGTVHGNVLYVAVNTATGEAWIGGVVTKSDAPVFPTVGSEFVFKVVDNGQGAGVQDEVSSVIYGGPGTAASALGMPVFGTIPWTNGNVQVK